MAIRKKKSIPAARTEIIIKKDCVDLRRGDRVSWIKLSWVPEDFSRAGWNIFKSAQFPPKPRASKERDNIKA